MLLSSRIRLKNELYIYSNATEICKLLDSISLASSDNNLLTTMRPCCISGCERNKRSGLIKMCMFPKIQNQTETFRKLSKQRQLAWLSALGNKDADPNSYENYRVCEAHFISGNTVNWDNFLLF